MITITGIGDRDRPEWMIRITGIRSPQRLDKLRRLAQLWLEAANAEPRQRRFHAIDDARALSSQGLPLAAEPLGILLLDRGNR